MKQAIVLGGLLAVALVGAYVTWTAPEESVARKATDVLVYRADAGSVAAVTWTEEARTVRLEQRSDASGTWLWVEQTDRTKVVPPAPEAVEGQPPPPAPEPEITEESTRFTGNDQATEIWTAFAPLYALRELTLTPDTDLTTYGLDAPKATIEVALKDRSVTLEVGGEAYGTRDRYVRADGRVYLVDDATIRPIQFAKSRLVERKLQPFEEADIEQISVRRGADARAFVQKNTADRANAFWADATKPEDRDVEGTTWLGKLFRLRAKSFVDEATVGALVPVFAFDVKGADGSWTVEIARVEKDGAVEYYARSSFLRALVDVTRSLAEEPIADLDTLFDGVAAPAEPPVEAPPEAPAGEPKQERGPAKLPSSLDALPPR
jgi:hypothetical protein